MMENGEKSVTTTESEPKEFSCKWICSPGQNGEHSCKTHTKEVKYTNEGKSERSDSAPKSWKDTHKKVPWLWPEKDDGIDSKHTNDDYHIRRGKAASEYPYPKYATEGHHLISCDVFNENDFPALVKNAKLVGYDINHVNNGYHVPAFVVDIICHDLQHHASNHSWSDPASLEYKLDEKVEHFLRQLQEFCYRYCELDPDGDMASQKKIVNDLNRVSEIVRKRIKNWSWYLTKLAKMRLGDLEKYDVKVPKKRGVNIEVEGKKVRYEEMENALFARERKELELKAANLMPKGFPNWNLYIRQGKEALEKGENPNQPFSRWLSRQMLKNKKNSSRAEE